MGKNLSFKGKLIVISDFINKKHFCDVFINFHIKNKQKIQSNILKKNCQFLLGKKYILIENQENKILILIKIYFQKRKKNILLFFGTTDNNNHTYNVLKLFQKLDLKNYNIISILGTNYKFKEKIKKI